MRIVVNDIAASKGGALSVLKDFYNCVKENDKENEWIFLLGDKYLEETENIKIITLPHIKKSRFKKLIFDFFSGKKFIKDLKPDVVFSLQNTATFGLNITQIVYIHQSIPFQSNKSFSFFKRKERSLAVCQYLIGWVIKKSAKICDKVIVQTESMKKEVCNRTHIDSGKVFVFYPNMSNIFTNENIRQSEYSGNEFFYPTSNAIYKNNDCIIDACNILNEKGVYDFTVKLTIEEIKHPNILPIGYISREEVLAQYAHSVLVFPSYIESFGYPLAEARRMGTVILASDLSFSKEILENYENAYFFDPFMPEELAILMQRVISGKIAKRKITSKASDENCWIKVIDLLKEKI